MVKFDGKYVQENDRLRGHSVALFTRIYGEHESPDSANEIDQPGQIPPTYRGADASVSKFETQLWSDFCDWPMTPPTAAPWVSASPKAKAFGALSTGLSYTVTLETNGGLNITSEKIRGIYSELLPRQPIQK